MSKFCTLCSPTMPKNRKERLLNNLSPQEKKSQLTKNGPHGAFIVARKQMHQVGKDNRNWRKLLNG